MNIALIGYGRMGKSIEKIAMERGHTIGLIIDRGDQNKLTDTHLENIDVAIEFSNPRAAYHNITSVLHANVPVVSGTTGWLNRLAEVKELVLTENKSFLYASNFSLGVNLFFALNTYLAELMDRYKEYEVSVEEIHHIHKLDAPSGTAITLAEQIIDQSDELNGWTLDEQKESQVPIYSIRKDEVPGTHSIAYNSRIDSINIEHVAHSREGFALGAVLAAEWIKDKVGFFGMKDVLGLDQVI